MSAPFTIKDGQGTSREARVSPTTDGNNALWAHVGGSSKGTVIQITDSVVGSLYDEPFENAGSSDLLVNGSITAVDFRISAHATKDIVITEIFVAAVGSGIKLSNYLSKNAAITNGVLFSWKADNQSTTLRPLTNTHEIEQWGSGAFSFFSTAGGDTIKSARKMVPNLIIRAQNKFGSGQDDYISCLIQDDLSSGITSHIAVARGLLVEADTL